MPESVEAPIKRGDALGEAVYTMDGKRIGSVSILSELTVDKAGCKDYLIRVWKIFCGF